MKWLARGIAKKIKGSLYFAVAAYFAFFARIYLTRWNPEIITVTGSSGKTTLLHLFEAQLGDRACYSHHANSAFGIPFHILGLERKTYRISEWFLFALYAPLRAYRRVRPERIYVTEADAERPGEGKLLARLLRPHVLVWLSLDEAHGIQYDSIARTDEAIGASHLEHVKAAMAHEFGWLLRETRSFVVLNHDNPYITQEASKAMSEIVWIADSAVAVTDIQHDSITFAFEGDKLSSPHLIPPDAGLSLFAVASVLKHLGLPVDPRFTKLILPPGRSSVLRGARRTTLIDSTYNATISGMRAMLGLFKAYPAEGEKWLVLGDMVEQGESEAEEHAALAKPIIESGPARVVLVGPRLRTHTLPLLTKALSAPVAAYDMPGEAYTYLMQEIAGGETILFKGARYLEGIVERLLLDPADASKLCRRGAIWDKTRKAWGI
jgi:UDP-N-acetylmuramoyl-tripeptide--D-alanyl-D-alanine ligase